MNSTPMHRARYKGQIDGVGWACRDCGIASNTVVRRTSRRSVDKPVATGISTVVSHSGCRLSTMGVCTNEYVGGGEATAHSRPYDAHGFGPASSPANQLLIALIRNR